MVDPVGLDRLPPGWPLVEADAQAPTAVYRAVEDTGSDSRLVISLNELTDAVKSRTGSGGDVIDLYA